MLTVGHPYLPDRKRLETYLDRIYETRWLTNNGPLVRELEEKLADFLGVENLMLVANGTLALQVAFRALGLSDEAVTTPFTFVATSAALRNEGLGVCYSDIDSDSLNLDPSRAIAASGPKTTAIVPVHVYGNPCDVEALEELTESSNLKVIYDAAHALGVDYNGESILKWGDASTLSLHATKLFHTGEGGAVVFRRREDLERARRLINFGLDSTDGTIPEVGMNAKMSELHAAVGLTMLEDLPTILENRSEVVQTYERELKDWVEFPRWSEKATRNGAYAPILLESREMRDRVLNSLKAENIYGRPYFSPSLDTTEAYKTNRPLANAKEKAERVLCLPVFKDLDRATIESIGDKIKKVL